MLYLSNRTTEQELNRGKDKLAQMNSTLEQEKEKCNNSIQQYQSQLNEINAELHSLESGDKIDPSDIITPSAPIYKQIFNSHAQEMVRFPETWPYGFLAVYATHIPYIHIKF